MFQRLRNLVVSFIDAYRGLPRGVWLLCAVLLVNRCGTMVLPFWTLYCKSDREFSELQVGSLLAIYGLGSVIGSVLGGWLTTRIGAMRVQWMSLFLTGTGFLLLKQFETYAQIAGAFFALSVVAESIRPASATAVANLCPKKLHPRAMALNRLAINLGMSLGPALGGFLADRSFQLLFMCDGISCILSGVLFVSMFGFGDSIAPADRPRAKLLRPWADREFALFGLCNFLLAIVFFQLLGTYVLYLDEVYGLEKSQIGLLMAINTISIVIFEMVLVRRVERYPALRVIAIGFFFSGVGFCILPYGAGMKWAALSVAIWTLGEMLSMPIAAAYSAGRAGPEERGNFMGAYSMTYSAASVVAPIVGMWLYSFDPNYVWYAGFALTAIVTVGTWTLGSRSEKRARRQSETVNC